MEEMNDYYDLKNRVGNIIIDNQYDPNTKLSDTERLKETMHKVFEELDKYREKHSKYKNDV